MPLLMNAENREPDDFLHNPDPRADGKINGRGSIITLRGLEKPRMFAFSSFRHLRPLVRDFPQFY